MGGPKKLSIIKSFIYRTAIPKVQSIDKINNNTNDGTY